jgi:ribosome-associated protein
MPLIQTNQRSNIVRAPPEDANNTIWWTQFSPSVLIRGTGLTMSHEDIPEELEQFKSKSQVKREMKALQLLGKRLTELGPAQLAKMPLEEDLLEAINDYKRFTKNEALRRQMHFIGRLLRNSDSDTIAAQMKNLDDGDSESRWKFDHIEKCRAKLLADKNYLTTFLQNYPLVDVQHLRQLIRNTQKEQAREKDLGGNKKLFRYLRGIVEEGQD